MFLEFAETSAAFSNSANFMLIEAILFQVLTQRLDSFVQPFFASIIAVEALVLSWICVHFKTFDCFKCTKDRFCQSAQKQYHTKSFGFFSIQSADPHASCLNTFQPNMTRTITSFRRQKRLANAQCRILILLNSITKCLEQFAMSKQNSSVRLENQLFFHSI